ncbi:hypothetical protein [Bremerella alba]|nr:hypothetical protein [Bremerella alba]
MKITLLLLISLCGLASVQGEELDNVTPPLGEFPAPGTGMYLSGEVVFVDPINRRAALRIDGDGVENRYDKAAPSRFAMLPYGSIWYQGALADLRDVPIGTHVHGLFYRAPDWDRSIPPYDGRRERGQYVSPYTHCLLLEDDFSWYQRRGVAWEVTKITTVTTKKVAKHGGVWDEPVPAMVTMIPVGKSLETGLQGPQDFSLDDSTIVWKDRGLGTLEDLKIGQIVQFNLAWCRDWKNKRFHLGKVWIDEASREAVTARQRAQFSRNLHHYWLPGWIGSVEYQEPGKFYQPDKNYHEIEGEIGKGIITVTLFDNIGEERLQKVADTFKVSTQYAMCASENTLRTWLQPFLSCGRIMDVKRIANPPPGSSGIQFRLWYSQPLQEWHRPGRIIRFRPEIPSVPNSWEVNALPPEFRIREPKLRFSELIMD